MKTPQIESYTNRLNDLPQYRHTTERRIWKPTTITANERTNEVETYAAYKDKHRANERERERQTSEKRRTRE